MNVVVVESPAKAKTINKYLGKDYHVLASYGHVRDLPAKDGSVRPDEDFSMSWLVDERGEKRLSEIAAAVKNSKHLYLATDPDREGEAISWHIVDELKRRKVLDGVDVERVVFNEITKKAIVEAFQHPRRLNQELIDAYMARRALDYLVGFTLSPVLWRKLPGSRSAGRVQSVALRLVCEREAEIEVFRPREYWSIEVNLENPEGAPFTARLTHLDGTKLDKFDLADEASARAAAHKIEAAARLAVAQVERKQTKRNPYPPFTTSTLQQEASRKLGFGATRTMRVAQKLYEGIDIGGETVGLITYMRTDGVTLAQEALDSARALIGGDYGDAYLPDAPRQYKSKQKNAQEAHEAIRPTDVFRRPKDMRGHLDDDGRKLYELIWNRTVACQMASAELDQVAVDIDVDGKVARLRATGSIVTFEGFLKLYQEDKDDSVDAKSAEDDDSTRDRRLPKLNEGDTVKRGEVLPEQHFTQPPPRYSEASLVKKMEELGIGRPSTYASILQVLQDRNYVRIDRRRFVPEDRGRLVVAFLASFFERYVQYNFTAEMEERLDDISGGRVDWRRVLRDFWEAFSTSVDGAKDLSITEVIDALDRDLGPHFFPVDPNNPGKDPRACPACGEGRLGLRLGRNGGFIGCSNYPECRFTRPLAVPGEEDDIGVDLTNPKVLGQDPESGKDVTLRKGPFGIYLQLGEAEGDEKPKRASLPKNLAPAEIDLQTGLALLALPREVGMHPEDGKPLTAGIGRFGPYVKHGSTYRSLTEGDDVLTIGLNRAVALIAEAPQRGAGGGRQLGAHPEDGKVVSQGKGRFGPYVKHGKLYATIPADIDPESVTLEQALELLKVQAEKKAAKGGGAKKAPAKKAAKKTAKKKAPAKKAAAKKSGTKKTAAKKAPKKSAAKKKSADEPAAD
ncbi:type I DNA topoisomerase [Pelagibius sp. 7325]|uniref:type I DNA topoisomerase n=1 Tax=Pelagibius sp. 7325 TaxID=3131994 RepID=UPI0030EB2D81